MASCQHPSPETLVLVPGLLCDETVWAPQIRHFADRYDVRVPELDGHGSIEAMAAAVLETAPERFSLVGHSMGARVAIQMIGVAPDRILRLALLDTGIHPVRDQEPQQRQRLIDLADREGMRALADAWLPKMVRSASFVEQPGLREAIYAMIERKTPALHRQQIIALLERPEAGAVLRTIKCPTLIGVGAEDEWSPPAQHHEMAAMVPGAQLCIFPSSGHMSPLEAPDAVNAALDQWLSVPSSL